MAEDSVFNIFDKFWVKVKWPGIEGFENNEKVRLGR